MPVSPLERTSHLVAAGGPCRAWPPKGQCVKMEEPAPPRASHPVGIRWMFMESDCDREPEKAVLWSVHSWSNLISSCCCNAEVRPLPSTPRPAWSSQLPRLRALFQGCSGGPRVQPGHRCWALIPAQRSTRHAAFNLKLPVPQFPPL